MLCKQAAMQKPLPEMEVALQTNSYESCFDV